jgi:WD40 repeat protein
MGGLAVARCQLVIPLVAAWLVGGGHAAGADPKPIVELRVAEDGLPALDVQWLGFSPDGKYLAARYGLSASRGRVRVWKCADWAATDADFDCHALRQVRPACAFDPTGATLYVAADGALHAYALPPKAAPRSTRLPDVPTKSNDATQSLDLGPDGKTLRVTTVDFKAGLVRVDECRLTDPAALTPVTAIRVPRVESTPALSPDGSVLAFGTATPKEEVLEYALEVWSTGGKRLARYAGLEGWVHVARFSPDGRWLLTGRANGSLTRYDTGTWEGMQTQASDNIASCIDFHPTRPLVAYGTFAGSGNPNAHVVDLRTMRVLANLAADSFALGQVRFSPDGKWLATVGGRRGIRVWELDGLMEH